MDKCLHEHKSSFLWKNVKSTIARTYIKSTIRFEKNCQTIFQSDYHLTFLPAMFERSSFSISLPTFGVIIIFILVNLIVIQRYLIVVLICIFLMANDIEHPFMCLLPSLYLQMKCLCMSFVHFLIGLFVFVMMSLKLICILQMKGLYTHQIHIFKFFTPAWNLFFILLIESLTNRKFFISTRSKLSIFNFIHCAIW